MSNPSPTIEEIAWTDACIRWEDEAAPSDPNNDNEDEDEQAWDPFQDPDPTEEFSFNYHVGDREIRLNLTGYKADADQTWQSTGLTLWKASHTLNDYLVEHAQEWKGYRVLELGAGLGVCGILLDRLWNDPSATICITDGDTQALSVLRQNIQRNNAYATCRQLLWGKEMATSFDQQPYQVIMASDIIYAPSVLVPLWETIQELLDTQGLFVLAFAQRKVPVQLDHVLKTSIDFGLAHKCILHDSEQEIFLYEFRKKLE